MVGCLQFTGVGESSGQNGEKMLVKSQNVGSDYSTPPPIHFVLSIYAVLETECLCKFVSLVMFVPGQHYISGALEAQSSSAYSSSTDEG